MVTARSLLATLAALALVQCSYGLLDRYDDEKILSNFLVYRRGAMFTLDEAPFKLSEDPRSAIEVKFDIEFSDEAKIAEVVVFPIEEFENVGFLLDIDGKAQRIFCCNEELAQAGQVCSESGRLIFDKKASMAESFVVRREDGDLPTHISKSFPIRESAIYYLAIANCNGGDSSIKVSGTARWINPYGYLPGELYGYLPFYSHMSTAYLLCALVWAFMCARQWRELLMLQNWCTLVIAFGLLEVYLRYMDFYHLNKDGERSKFLLASSVFFLAVKKTVSRLLVLTVSLGWGIVRPTLGDWLNRVLLVGSAYFFFSMAQLTSQSLSHSHKLSFGGYLLVLPVVGIDLVIFMWVFSSLSDVISSLEARKQHTKLALYRNFRIILILCIITAIAWTLFVSYAIMNNWGVTHWDSFWRLDATWDVLYFGVLVLVLLLWRPSTNSNRYAYDRVATHDQEAYDEELEDLNNTTKDRR